MALNAYLKLKANGVDLPGESKDGLYKDWIEVESFSWGVLAAREAGSGLSTGRRVYKEFRWVNTHHKSSVLIWKALAQNQVVEGTLKTTLDDPQTGETANFMTIAFKGGRISAFDQAASDGSDGIYEEIALVFQTIRVTNESSGVEHEDTWSTQA